MLPGDSIFKLLVNSNKRTDILVYRLQPTAKQIRLKYWYIYYLQDSDTIRVASRNKCCLDDSIAYI